MADQLLPNAVRLVTEWAKTRTPLTDLVATRISYQLAGTLPAIRLSKISQPSTGPEEALVRIQVECWAADYDTADLVARTVESEVGTLAGFEAVGGRCAGGAVTLGPFSQPDEESERHRFLLDLELWVYPA